MATSDSGFSFDYHLAEFQPGPAPARPAKKILTFDLLSDQPLPDFDEKPVLDERPLSPPEDLPNILLDLVDNSPEAKEKRTTEKRHGIWLENDVLMCGCPDCRAPMSIRTWLMVADCWKCSASIELSEEQEKEVNRLLAEQEKRQQAAQPQTPVKRPQPRSEPAKAKSDPAPPPPPPQPAEKKKEEAKRPTPPRPPQPEPKKQETPQEKKERKAATFGARAKIKQLARAGSVRVWLSDLFKETPAWLVSAVFHFVLLTLAALFTIHKDDGNTITLSASVSTNVREGGDTVQIPHHEEAKFDLPIPKEIDLSNPQTREAMVKADQEAKQLRIDPDIADPVMADLAQVKSQIKNRSGSAPSFAARDPRVRVEMVKKEGGTTLTEAAVSRGLKWLADNQNESGSWSLEKHGGGIRSDAAATSLALMPFLGAGNTHLVGPYKDHVAQGLRWLVQNQEENGDLSKGSQGNSAMYAHGQAAIVLCEAFAMTGDEDFRAPAQKAIDFIVQAQHPRGGWRYRPGEEGDTSVVGWQLMALQSARTAGLSVPPETFENASHYLDLVQHAGGSQYSYMKNQGPTETMSAEGLLCRVYLGWKRDTPALQEGIANLVNNHLPRSGEPNIYYWYYATQMMHHAGGEAWEKWNLQMRDVLVDSQIGSRSRGVKPGEEKLVGSWQTGSKHAGAGGRVYETALAVCSLEVYYRHLPIFKQIDIDD